MTITETKQAARTNAAGTRTRASSGIGEAATVPPALALIPLAALAPEQGAAVLLPDGTAAAVFLLHDGTVHAVGNIDPFYSAPVICHGIVGDRSGVPTVVSPLGKQAFCLRTGRCLDDPAVSLPVFSVRAHGGLIQLSTPGNTGETGIRTS